LLSVTINIGPDSGADVFDIVDDSVSLLLYQRLPNNFDYTGINSETGDLLDMELNLWSLTRAGTVIGSGPFSALPAVAPEPGSLFLVIPAIALIGLRWRRRRRHA
jgi:hypothetical protein